MTQYSIQELVLMTLNVIKYFMILCRILLGNDYFISETNLHNVDYDYQIIPTLQKCKYYLIKLKYF